MESKFLKEGIVIITENISGELYMIEAESYNDIVNDWYGDCHFIPANDAKVFFASYNGVAISPYSYNDFESLIRHIRSIL